VAVKAPQTTDELLENRPDFRTWWSLARAYHSVAGPIERFFDERKITGAQFGVLRCLTDAGDDGLMLSDLSRRLLVTCGNITGVVDRLEAADYLRRERSEEDRRVVRARLTEAGRTFYSRLLPDYLALVRELMSGLDQDDLESLGTTAQLLYASLEAGKAGEPPTLAVTPPFPAPMNKENE
jgi:DNA-binding MarR family transcriptional regulator